MTSRLLAWLAVAVLLTGCQDDTSSSPTPETATQTTAAPAPAGPRADGCYDLAYDAAVAPTTDSAPVDCAAPHTTETVAVGRVTSVVDGHLLAIDSEEVQGQVAAACPTQLQKYVGASLRKLRLSMVRPVWFTPTVDDSDKGADWYRCDAVVLAGDREISKVTGRLKGALVPPKVPARLAMCGTSAPDKPNFERVPCTVKHTWKAIDVVVFKAGRYPGVKVAKARGRGQCEDAAADLADDPLTFDWGYEWPSKQQWEMGQTYGRCWIPAA